MTSSASITVSLEVAKELKKAGWDQDKSIFYWDGSVPPWEVCLDVDRSWSYSATEEDDGKCIAAPTAEEILRRLPRSIYDEGGEYVRICFPSGSHNEGIQYKHLGGLALCAALEDDDTLANAAAKMWIYLKQHDLLPQQP